MPFKYLKYAVLFVLSAFLTESFCGDREAAEKDSGNLYPALLQCIKQRKLDLDATFTAFKEAEENKLQLALQEMKASCDRAADKINLKDQKGMAEIGTQREDTTKKYQATTERVIAASDAKLKETKTALDALIQDINRSELCRGGGVTLTSLVNMLKVKEAGPFTFEELHLTRRHFDILDSYITAINEALRKKNLIINNLTIDLFFNVDEHSISSIIAMVAQLSHNVDFTLAITGGNKSDFIKSEVFTPLKRNRFKVGKTFTYNGTEYQCQTTYPAAQRDAEVKACCINLCEYSCVGCSMCFDCCVRSTFNTILMVEQICTHATCLPCCSLAYYKCAARNLDKESADYKELRKAHIERLKIMSLFSYSLESNEFPLDYPYELTVVPSGPLQVCQQAIKKRYTYLLHDHLPHKPDKFINRVFVEQSSAGAPPKRLVMS